MGVIETAFKEWDKEVIDPRKSDHSPNDERCRAEILKYIHNGLGWQDWVQQYPGDGAFAWCGAFAAYCWRMNGLRFTVAKKNLASTYRLSEWGKKNPRRVIRIADIQPGDIVVIEGTQARPYGDHITLAVAWDLKQSTLVTVEGNAHGRLPSGKWSEGVVLNQRPRGVIRAAYRPIEEDLE